MSTYSSDRIDSLTSTLTQARKERELEVIAERGLDPESLWSFLGLTDDPEVAAIQEAINILVAVR